MRKIQNQAELFIANGTITTHAPHGTSFAAGFTSVLEDGEVALLNVLTNTIHNAAFPTSGMYKFVARSGDSLLVSNVFDASTVTKTERAYSAQTEQVDYIGYNGTSGSFDGGASSVANEIYTLHIDIKGQTRTDFNKGLVKEGHYITTKAATAQWEIAQGIVTNLIANFSKFPNPMIRFERVCDEAMTALGTGVNNLTFTYGSAVVTCDGDIDDYTGGTTDNKLAVGRTIRIGTAVTDPVYFIAAIDTSNQTITLDVPYQGATTTVADTGCEMNLNSTAIAAEWGLKLTGIAQPYSTQKYVDTLIMWNATFTKINSSGQGVSATATVTNATTPAYANGSYAQVAEMERELQMGDGYQLYSDIPMPSYRAQANSAKTYNMFSIRHTKDMTTHLGQEAPSICGIIVAADTGLTYGTDQVTYTVTFSAGSKGNYSITAGGVTGYQEWDTNTDTTHAEFVTDNGANFLLAGITVTYTSGSDMLSFVGPASVLTSAPVLVNHSDGTDFGDFAATIAKTAASGWTIWSSTDDAGSSL